MRTVVVGVAGDRSSGPVLQRALAEARTAARPLEVLHAWSVPTWAAAAVGLDDVHAVDRGTAQAQGVAAEALASALLAGGEAAPAASSVRGAHGEPGPTLVQQSAQAGLLVLGAPSHGRLLGAVLGAASAVVLRHASCPVMVVPVHGTTAPFRRVVVGYDAPTHAGSALRWAVDAARRHRCPLVVVHALPLTPTPVPRSVQSDDARREDEVRHRLDHHVARALRGHEEVPVTTCFADGSAFEVLLREAGPDDLLVLGSRAHRGVAETLLGAVALECVQHATGTVVVVRAGQERLDDVPGAARPRTVGASTRTPDGTGRESPHRGT
ncbi:MAG: UspA [Frankiales bacterium]|nr:UspA [Frankiales bacterium]